MTTYEIFGGESSSANVGDKKDGEVQLKLGQKLDDIAVAKAQNQTHPNPNKKYMQAIIVVAALCLVAALALGIAALINSQMNSNTIENKMTKDVQYGSGFPDMLKLNDSDAFWNFQEQVMLSMESQVAESKNESKEYTDQQIMLSKCIFVQGNNNKQICQSTGQPTSYVKCTKFWQEIGGQIAVTVIRDSWQIIKEAYGNHTFNNRWGSWIGMKLRHRDFAYQYIDGVDETNENAHWGSGEPSDFADCVVVFDVINSSDFGLFDSDCTHAYCLCEI